jgi:hypothetical protein
VNESTDHLELPNKDLDTGALTAPGEYKGADLAYDKLLGRLADKKFAQVSADLRDNILSYYDGRKAPVSGALASDISDKQTDKRDAKARADWQKVTTELEQLRQFQIAVVAAQ